MNTEDYDVATITPFPPPVRSTGSALRTLVIRGRLAGVTCPRPAATRERAARAAAHRTNTRMWSADKRQLLPWQFPLFDDEPGQHCRKAG